MNETITGMLDLLVKRVVQERTLTVNFPSETAARRLRGQFYAWRRLRLSVPNAEFINTRVEVDVVPDTTQRTARLVFEISPAFEAIQNALSETEPSNA